MLRGEGNARIWVLVVTLASTLLLCQARMPDFTGLTGPYCETRRPRSCCDNRQDDCSVPILGTLCYCDTFCLNETVSDCCPDFKRTCAPNDPGPPSNFTGTCIYKDGKEYYPNNKIKENCNVCKCSAMDDKYEFLCEENKCLMEQEVIDRVREKNLGWIARNYSEFWGHTYDEGLERRLGTLNPSQSVYRMNAVRRIYNPDDLPKDFDARSRWPNDIAPIRDQGWCASSWAISTADVASDRFAVMSKGREKVQISAQHLLSCNNRGQLGCDGGYLDRAWLFLRKFGLTDERCYPYHAKVEKCIVPRKGKLSDAGCKQRNSYSLRNEFYKVGPAYRLGNETDIMYEILQSGPVQATMRVYQDFFNYGSGIYKHLDDSDRYRSEYHSVRIVGWGEERSPYDGRPIKFWRVANSWGSQWGEYGYFRIIRGSNECEIESFVLGVWAKTV